MRTKKWVYTAMVLWGFAAIVPEILRSMQSSTPNAETAAVPQEDADIFDEDDLPQVRFGVEVRMVSVPVTVRRADGSFHKGLTQKSFKIHEDGEEQEIVFFAEETVPTHIAIVLDISGSVRPEWGTIQHATRRFLEQLSPDDRFSLTTFNDEVRLKIPWGNATNNVNAVLTSVYCQGVTKLWDAVGVVSTDVFAGVEGKKAMIIMTDGMDNQSYETYASAVRAAVENEIAVYIVSKAEALLRYYEYLYPDGIPYEYFSQAESVLRQLAHDTGGRVLKPNNFGQLDDIYAEVTEELRNQYTVGYISSNTAKDGSYRKIDVSVSARDAPNTAITARPGYYAQRP